MIDGKKHKGVILKPCIIEYQSWNRINILIKFNNYYGNSKNKIPWRSAELKLFMSDREVLLLLMLLLIIKAKVRIFFTN